MLHKYSTLAWVILRFALCLGSALRAHNNDIWHWENTVWERMKGCNCCATKKKWRNVCSYSHCDAAAAAAAMTRRNVLALLTYSATPRDENDDDDGDGDGDYKTEARTVWSDCVALSVTTFRCDFD